jgi:cell division protease FtsH
VYYAGDKRQRYLDVSGPGAGEEYSQATAELIDQEIRDIIAKQFEKATDILRKYRKILDQGAEILLKVESIAGEEIKKLMKGLDQPGIEDRSVIK